ncbi:MAG: hypothetical protein ACLQVI_31655 [Polyangiaceae bacterium]
MAAQDLPGYKAPRGMAGLQARQAPPAPRGLQGLLVPQETPAPPVPAATGAWSHS